MAGNRRGKLKEHLEGVHRDFDWAVDHIVKSLKLIGDDNPVLSEALAQLATTVQQLDDLAQELYQKL